MAEHQLWAGLDLGARTTTVCIINELGESVREQPCRTDIGEIEAALADFRPALALIAVEAGTEPHLVRKLIDRAYPVRIFEARKASKFLAIRRNKTDSTDAKGLADLARLGRNTVSQVYLKSLECQRLRSQLVLRQKLIILRMAAENSVRARLGLYGRRVQATTSAKLFRDRVLSELSELRRAEGVDLEGDMSPLVEISVTLRVAQQKMDTELKAAAKAHPICQRLMEVPGVGPICALSFFSAIEDPGRFRHAGDVAAYLGLTPRVLQSGDRSRIVGITKNGNKLTRTHLVNAAVSLPRRQPECALAHWANSLRERIGSPRARVALARKLSIVLLTIWKNDRPFQAFPGETAKGLLTPG